MNRLIRLVPLFPAVLLAGCSSMGTQAPTPVVTAPLPTTTMVQPPVSTLPSPAQTTATALATTNAIDFLDPAAVPRLTQKDRTQASSAQFYALQFGRPGAPRSWVGDNGTKGSVNVGPYVRVNNLDCRDFTHQVTIAGATFTRKGTACREVDGTWSVVSTAAG